MPWAYWEERQCIPLSLRVTNLPHSIWKLDEKGLVSVGTHNDGPGSHTELSALSIGSSTMFSFVSVTIGCAAVACNTYPLPLGLPLEYSFLRICRSYCCSRTACHGFLRFCRSVLEPLQSLSPLESIVV